MLEELGAIQGQLKSGRNTCCCFFVSRRVPAFWGQEQCAYTEPRNNMVDLVGWMC